MRQQLFRAIIVSISILAVFGIAFLGYWLHTHRTLLTVNTKTVPAATHKQSSAPLANLPDKIPEGWKIYRDDKYRFQVGYLAKDRYADAGGLDQDISTLSNSATPLRVLSYVARQADEEGPTFISIGIYNKPTISLERWIFNGSWLLDAQPISSSIVQHIADIPVGTIDTALASARRGSMGVLTYSKYKDGDMDIYEIGDHVPGELIYTRYLTKDDVPYVYAIELPLQYMYVDTTLYINLYKTMVASFKTF